MVLWWFLNGKFYGDIGDSQLGVVIGTGSGVERGSSNMISYGGAERGASDGINRSW